MDNSLLIAVFVPTTDKAGKDFKGKRGELATGYPVEKDLILTARHILQTGPPYYRDGRYPVRIVWHCSCSNDKADWIAIPDQDIVWPSQKDLDAALIRCSPPRDGMGWGIVSRDRPLDKMEWASEGFPAFPRYKKEGCTNRFSGKVRSNALNEFCFELNVEKAPEVGDDWKGVSGMPVFAGRKIIGVVQSVPPNFNARKLYATPTWKLLEDEAFRQAIGHDEQLAHLNKTRNKLVTLLKSSPEVINAIIEQKSLGLRDDKVGLSDGQGADWLVEHLLRTDIRTVIQALRAAHRSFYEDESDISQQNAAAVTTLVKAAKLIVPALYDYGVVKWVGSQGNDRGTALVLLPAYTKTVAEIIMAGVDGRETKFCFRQNENDPPEGELSLPHPPEHGIFSDSAKTRAAMHDHADRKFCLGEKANNCRRMIDDGLFTLYAPGSGEPEIKLADQRIKAIANQFRRMQADKGVTFYMVFYLPDDEDERNTMLAMIQSLKDDYQEAIMFLGINSDFDQREQEKNLFYPFYSMFPFKPNEPSPTSQEKLSPMSTQRFKIALSFPGEHRSFVEQVASKLAHEVGRYQVLYDRYYEAEFARPDLDTYLQRLYHDESELIAVFLCADYERKEWCGLEWRAVRDLIKKRKASTVMPLRFDNTEIPGLFSIDGYVWIDKRTPEQIADLILQRMGKHP